MKTYEKYLKEGFKIQIKGITHDWMDLDKAFKTEKNSFSSKKEAEKRMNKAIKAGRSAKSIRIVKEAKVIDITSRLKSKGRIDVSKKMSAVIDATSEYQKAGQKWAAVLKKSGYMQYAKIDAAAKEVNNALSRFIIAFLEVTEK